MLLCALAHMQMAGLCSSQVGISSQTFSDLKKGEIIESKGAKKQPEPQEMAVDEVAKQHTAR